MEITNVRVRRVTGEGKLRAYCSVEFDRMLTAELRVIEGVHGLFVSMPSQKDKKGKYWDLVYPTTAEMRQVIQNAVLGTYHAMAQAVIPTPEETALLPQEESEMAAMFESEQEPVEEALAVQGPTQFEEPGEATLDVLGEIAV